MNFDRNSTLNVNYKCIRKVQVEHMRREDAVDGNKESQREKLRQTIRHAMKKPCSAASSPAMYFVCVPDGLEAGEMFYAELPNGTKTEVTHAHTHTHTH